MQIPINNQLALTELFPTDSQAVCRHLSDPAIAATTTGVPWPYSTEDFSATMARDEAAELEHGHPTYLAIRQANGLLIGVISFTNFFMGVGAEIGYWLAREWWGQGIMTATEFCPFPSPEEFAAHFSALWPVTEMVVALAHSSPNERLTTG